MSEQWLILMALYGPGTFGMVVLLLVCVFTRHWPAFIFGAIASIVLQSLSFALIFGLVGVGSWGNSSALEHPLRVLRWALGITGALVCGKIVHIIIMRQKEFDKLG